MEITYDYKTRHFAEFLEAKGYSYSRVRKKYQVPEVKGICYVEANGEKFLIYEADLKRLLTQWKMAGNV